MLNSITPFKRYYKATLHVLNEQNVHTLLIERQMKALNVRGGPTEAKLNVGKV